MMVDIFSSLDGGVNVSMSVLGFVWLSAFVSIFMFFCKFWVVNSSASSIISLLVELIFGLVKSCSGKLFGGFALGQVCLFLMIFVLNISGMVPGVFSSTSHLSLTFSLALVVWFCLIMSGWVSDWKRSAGHLVPTGSPTLLIPLLVIIESVSVLIRPITLGVRLAANITMGHLMLHVIGEYVVSFICMVKLVSVVFGSLIISGYMIFEFAVSFLQAYVFVLLVGLYSSDHPVGH